MTKETRTSDRKVRKTRDDPEFYLIIKQIGGCTGNGGRKHGAILRGDRVSPFVQFTAFEGLTGPLYIYS